MMSMTVEKAWEMLLATSWPAVSVAMSRPVPLCPSVPCAGMSGGYRMMQGQRMPPSFVEAFRPRDGAVAAEAHLRIALCQVL